MKIMEVCQGSAEWLALRAQHHCASEAPAMMGCSKYQSRNDLLRVKFGGTVEEVSEFKQALFDKGHEAEAKARAIVERMIGEELYPVTGTQGTLLASFDGINMGGDTGFEHKLWNVELAAAVEALDLPPMYYWQLEQQLLVGGLEKVIFVCSDGTEENFVSMEYFPVPGRAEQLIAGWKQFDADLANYSPVEVLPPAQAEPIKELPALTVVLVGQVTKSNLEDFRRVALARIAEINTDLQTDEDFANADGMVKFLDGGEKKLALVKEQALAQTSSIDELFRTVDHIKEVMRAKRLELTKLVEARKVNLREEIRAGGNARYAEHVHALNTRLGRPMITLATQPSANFADAMKGKRSFASMRDAVDTELARVKIASNELADRLQINLQHYANIAEQYAPLFRDLDALLFKPADDFALIVKTRIAEHKAEQDRKLEADRAKIRAEEEAKAKAEAEAKLRAEQAAAQPIPAPVTAQPAVAPAPLQREATVARIGTKPTRPTDTQIIDTIASTFNVSRKVAIDWICEMELGHQAAE